MALGTEKLMKENFDIFLATDPDADRLGVVVRHKNSPYMLTGNQVAAIAAFAVAKSLKNPAKAAFVRSIVTTDLMKAVVEKSGSHLSDVLPGFKYIAEKIRTWEQNPTDAQFVFGAEESYGYLLGTHVRDKDAVVASCLWQKLPSI